MNIRVEIQPWIIRALSDCGGHATITAVAKHIWEHHEKELRSNEDIFFNWQYEMRWAAGALRKRHKIAPVKNYERGSWGLP